jgi:hypothetical protein
MEGASKIESFRRAVSIKVDDVGPATEPEKEAPLPTPTANEMEDLLEKEMELQKAQAGK